MEEFKRQWFLFDYKDGVPDVISKPFKTKREAEKARAKYPPKQQGRIGVGVMRIPLTRRKKLKPTVR